MDFHIIGAFVRSASFELDNTDIYKCGIPYSVELDGKPAVSGGKANVFSLYNLIPAKTYEVTVRAGGESATKLFSTRPESFRLDVRDFGAAGDGRTVDTAALQAAVLCCPRGGTVRIPEGTYYTAPVFLKSDITLELEKGAVLLGVTDRERYPVLPGVTQAENEEDEYYLGVWEGNPLSSYASLLTGIGVENVDIIGEGVVDANAEAGGWWEDPKRKHGAWRPRVLFLNRCRNIRIQGVSFRNSYSWTIHPFLSSRIGLIDIRVRNDPESPNTDGVDIDSCRGVRVLGAVISVGDDCIAVKSGKKYLGLRLGRASCGIEIRNCLLERGHGAVVIGSEVSSGIRGVRASRCVFRGTDKGLRVKARRGRGARSAVDGVVLERIRMDGVASPFVVNMFYSSDPDGHSEFVRSKEKMPVGEFTPKVGVLRCGDIECLRCSTAGMFFYGLPEMPIESISLERVSVSFEEDARPGSPAMMDGVGKVKKLGLYANNVKRLSLKEVAFSGCEGEKIVTKNVREFLREER